MLWLITSLVVLVVLLCCWSHTVHQRLFRQSTYMIAAANLGFTGYCKSNGEIVTMKQHQEALLKIFQLAGYFDLSVLWQDLNSIGGINNPELVFKELTDIVIQSGANQKDPKKFNARHMARTLFSMDIFDLQDTLDLILYIAQHAFNRPVGQERYEIVPFNWMNNYADEYIKEARILRLIDEERPSRKEYDGGWIAGAARITLSQRIIQYMHYIVSEKIKINGETLVLAGEREIWANIDGILPEAKKN